MKNAHAQWLNGYAFPTEWEKDVFKESTEAYRGDTSSYRFLIAIYPASSN